MKERVIERDGGSKISAGSLLELLQRPELAQAKARCPDLHAGLSRWWQGPKHSDQHWLLSWAHYKRAGTEVEQLELKPVFKSDAKMA